METEGEGMNEPPAKGIELDCWIAEHVMGFKVTESRTDFGHKVFYMDYSDPVSGPEQEGLHMLPRYSADGFEAFRAAEKLIGVAPNGPGPWTHRKWSYSLAANESLQKPGTACYVVSFTAGTCDAGQLMRNSVASDSVPHALCLGMWKAIESLRQEEKE